MLRQLSKSRRIAVPCLTPAFVAALALAATVAPAAADPGPRPGLQLAQSGADEDGSLLDEDQLSKDAERAVRDFLEMIEPALTQFQALIQDLPAYEPPEILPNGDIIIRRKRGWGEGGEPDAPAEEGGRTKT